MVPETTAEPQLHAALAELPDEEFDLLCFPTQEVHDLMARELPGFDQHVASCETCSERLSRIVEQDVGPADAELALMANWPWRERAAPAGERAKSSLRHSVRRRDPETPDGGLRRRFLYVLGRAACLLAATGVTNATSAADWLSSAVYQDYRSVLRRRLSQARRELLTWLLRPEGEVVYLPAKSFLGEPPSPQWREGFPHDRRAVAAFRALDAGDPREVRGGARMLHLSSKASVVATGSPLASDHTRLYLPHVFTEDLHEVSGTFDAGSLAYHFAVAPRSAAGTLRVRSASQSGRELAQPGHGVRIADSGRIWHPRSYDRGGWLNRDFLLLSRLPRREDEGEGDVVLVAGAHGVGTRAFELLLDEEAFPESQLRALADVLAGTRYFQIVFEVSDIDHDGAASSPGRIRIAEDVPPMAVRPVFLPRTRRGRTL